MIHVSLITCDTACIYLGKNKKAQGKVKKGQALIQSDLFMHLGIYSLQKLDSIDITKINADKWLYIYIYIYIKDSHKEK